MYDREEVLGRDATSVFPSHAKELQNDAHEATKAALGATQFITESELEELQASAGGARDNEGVIPNKPLAEVLREAKEAKEEAFQNQWKTMKQGKPCHSCCILLRLLNKQPNGKNRPLDEDELEFVDQILQQEQLKEKGQQLEESQQLEAFQQAVQLAAQARAAKAALTEKPAAAQVPSARKSETPQRKPVIKPRIQVKRQQLPAEEAEAKKARVEAAAAAPQEGAAFTGLAGYGSGSDSD
eukprot:jgi/Astpho2/7736/fgenesh1_pg.00116_%23_6_t